MTRKILKNRQKFFKNWSKSWRKIAKIQKLKSKSQESVIKIQVKTFQYFLKNRVEIKNKKLHENSNNIQIKIDYLPTSRKED